ncbi:MAG: PQQ-binding-like beta-propeller repeat protein [Proteobacteria bacterium]|nr:PQQ-binding-like beta-propeller repeat protein [Pseudomonadota bacterium]
MRNDKPGVRGWRTLVAVGCASLLATGVHADDDKAIGKHAFEKACVACHSDPPEPRAMPRDQLAKMPPEAIFAALLGGKMTLQAAALPEIERSARCPSTCPRSRGLGQDAQTVEQLTMCKNPAPLAANALEQPHWSGWGLDADNTHFQPAAQARLEPEDLANLEFKWALGFPAGTSVSTQTAVIGGRIYIGGPGNGIYALDAKSGCAHWKTETAGEVRGAIQAFKRADGSLMLVAADRKAMVYGLDADTGKILWQGQGRGSSMGNEHRLGRYPRRQGLRALRVLRELAGGSPTYECCTFRGSVNAYELETGKRLWKSYLIPEPAKKTAGRQWHAAVGAVGCGGMVTADHRCQGRRHLPHHRRLLFGAGGGHLRCDSRDGSQDRRHTLAQADDGR